VTLQILISASVAFVVTVLTHFLTSRRDIENKRREQRVTFLLNAYRALARANHHPRLYEVGEELAGAIHDIQLLGTPEQITLAQQFAKDICAKQTAGMDDLFDALRDNLRKELRAEPVEGRIQWLRIDKPQDQKSASAGPE
jgi:hypothetical protein